MNKKIHIIIDNLSRDIYAHSYTKVPNWAEMSLESVLGFYTDFDSNCLVKKDLAPYLPKQDIKLYFNMCYFPDAAPFIWINDEETTKVINSDRNSYLWIFSPHEATFRKEELIEKIEKCGVKKEKIIFTCSSKEFDGKIYRGVKFVSIPEWWESQYRHHLKKFDEVSFITPSQRIETLDTATRKVLSLNKNLKGHRIWFYYSMLDTSLFDDSYISYHLPNIAKKENYSEDGFKSWIRLECKRLPKHIVEQILNDERIFEVKQLDEYPDQIIWHKDSILPYYHDSLISIVTESLDVENFLTEKTFKAIMHCHPFILVGNSEMNQSLKDRGYKTFENFFGMETIETYEDAVKLIKNLERMPLEKYKYLIKNRYWEHIEHNWNHFMSRTISWKTVEEKLLRATS
jgi:hypothetical protein